MSRLRFDITLVCGVYKVEPTPCFACGSTFPFERGRDKRHISLTVDMPLVQGVYNVEPFINADGVTAHFKGSEFIRVYCRLLLTLR